MEVLAFIQFWYTYVGFVLDGKGVKVGDLYIPLLIEPDGKILGASMAHLRCELKSYLDGPGTDPGDRRRDCNMLSTHRV